MEKVSGLETGVLGWISEPHSPPPVRMVSAAAAAADPADLGVGSAVLRVTPGVQPMAHRLWGSTRNDRGGPGLRRRRRGRSRSVVMTSPLDAKDSRGTGVGSSGKGEGVSGDMEVGKI